MHVVHCYCVAKSPTHRQQTVVRQSTSLIINHHAWSVRFIIQSHHSNHVASFIIIVVVIIIYY
jgi:hypothetical protein